jgi:hypothetical protein
MILLSFMMERREDGLSSRGHGQRALLRPMVTGSARVAQGGSPPLRDPRGRFAPSTPSALPSFVRERARCLVRDDTPSGVRRASRALEKYVQIVLTKLVALPRARRVTVLAICTSGGSAI